MIPGSRQTVHIGVNFVMIPPPVIRRDVHVSFQGEMVKAGLDITRTNFNEQEPAIEVERDIRSPLQVRVIGGGSAPVGQLLIQASGSGSDVDSFIKEAEAVVQAFRAAWPNSNVQVIRSDATVQCLFESSSEHAFLELWEQRLHQTADALSALGEQVLGGGLRFVMPPMPVEGEIIQREVKIESFLRNPKKMFVEVNFMWPLPLPQGVGLDPGPRVLRVNRYINENVARFISGGASDG